MWNQNKLTQAANKRQQARAQFTDLERATLAYARWNGLTEETGVDTTKAKAELDKLLDAMDPEDWQGLEGLSGTTDDRILTGLMTYSLQRWHQELGQQKRELDALPDWPTPDHSPAPRNTKKKRRDRSR